MSNHNFPISPNPNPERLIDAVELSKILGYHKESVRRLALRGTIPSLKVGRAVRFRLSDVLASLEQRGGRYEND